LGIDNVFVSISAPSEQAEGARLKAQGIKEVFSLLITCALPLIPHAPQF